MRLWDALRALRWPAVIGRLRAGDGTVVLLLGLLVPAGVGWATTPPAAPIQAAAALTIVVLAIGVRPRSPIAALVLAGSVSAFSLFNQLSLWPALSVVVISFLVGRRSTQIREPQLAFAAVASSGLLLAVLLGHVSGWLTLLLTEFILSALPWWAGSWWRQRRQLLHAGWQRAEQLDRERRIAAEQARLHERTRIAQDMHDALGHELSLIALLAGGLELARDLPEEHRTTATQLRANAVSATRRLHEVVGLLRLDAEPATVEPGGTDLAGLVRRARESGVPVTLEEIGRPDPGAEPGETARRAAYRVVQEAVTNATKHAPGAEIVVRVEHLSTETTIAVTNAPPAHRERGGLAVGNGAGLIGLAERLRIAGGTLRAGAAGAGYEVVARVPHTTPVTAIGPERDRIPDELDRARQRHRENLLRGAVLPAVLAFGTAALLLAAYLITAATTSLHPDDFARLRIGQTRADLADDLPGHHIASPPPVLSRPPVPRESTCEYYRASSSLTDLTETMYRLCFAGDVLIAKDTLRR